LVLYTLDWSVQSLLERIGSTFDINPSFQRRDAWTLERKSLYIESLILGLPVPQIVLAEDTQRKGRFIVLDGKQRLITVKQFAAPNEQFASFKLKKLEFVHELVGMSFADMQNSLTADEHAENFLAQPIRTIVVRNWKDPAVLYQIFVRLNQGSLSLSPQELRQALYPNDFTKWINARSASSSLIHRARRIKSADFRMRDAEMLLRFVAFQESMESYRGNLRKFLDDACVAGASNWTTAREEYFESVADRCETAIQRTFDVFGETNAFLRFENGTYNRRFNVAVYDLMTTLFAEPSIDPETLEGKASDLRVAFEHLCENDRSFSESLQTTTKSIGSTTGRVLTYGAEIERVLGLRLPILERARAATGSSSASSLRGKTTPSTPLMTI
jgi:hypothetical protein